MSPPHPRVGKHCSNGFSLLVFVATELKWLNWWLTDSSGVEFSVIPLGKPTPPWYRRPRGAVFAVETAAIDLHNRKHSRLLIGCWIRSPWKCKSVSPLLSLDMVVSLRTERRTLPLVYTTRVEDINDCGTAIQWLWDGYSSEASHLFPYCLNGRKFFVQLRTSEYNWKFLITK